MRVYISGISGTGMGPLALMAKAAGFEVFGSDLAEGAIYSELKKAQIEVSIGAQDGRFLSAKLAEGIDWFVYTSALPKEHAELKMALEAGVKCTKRDDFTAFLVERLGLKMVAVAGTHGKTTTTAMIVWAGLELGLPISYIVGTTLGFAPSGAYHEGDKFFVYEADEYDRNFLKYHPWLAVIPSVSYDHPDIYSTREDYESAFHQFEAQSEQVLQIRDGVVSVDGREALLNADMFSLAGEARRQDAALAATAIWRMYGESGKDAIKTDELVEVLNRFPGVGRRFERLTDGLYTDYAHHPEEIEATIKIAQDECAKVGRKGVIVIYQPHQNVRQHEVRDEYREAFLGVDKILWLPTYLTRENPKLSVIRPEDFVADLVNAEIAEPAELDRTLENRIKQFIKDGYLVLLMAAGPADDWLRKRF